MPSVRLSWQVSHSDLFWAAVCRAVRTPVQIDRELEAPGILPDRRPDFMSGKAHRL